MEELLAKKYRALSGLLNERQSPLWVAMESVSLGYGEISLVSRAIGISRVTISREIQELEEEQRLSPERSGLLFLAAVSVWTFIMRVAGRRG